MWAVALWFLSGFLAGWWIFRVGKKLYIVYADIRVSCSYRKPNMKSNSSIEEIRWQVLKAMLDDFPSLRGKVKSYFEKAEN
jgi:hypothetical protein